MVWCLLDDWDGMAGGIVVYHSQDTKQRLEGVRAVHSYRSKGTVYTPANQLVPFSGILPLYFNQPSPFLSIQKHPRSRIVALSQAVGRACMVCRKDLTCMPSSKIDSAFRQAGNRFE
jgi:hypothetical protein